MAVNILSGVVVGRPKAANRRAPARRCIRGILSFLGSVLRAETYEWTAGPDWGQVFWLDALRPTYHPSTRR